MAYSKTFKPNRRDQAGVPWRTVVLLLVGVSVLVWTLRGSSASEGAQAAREAAFEKLYPGSRRPQSTRQAAAEEQAAQKWSERRVRQVYEEEELQTESDRANARAPALPFDPKVFQQYVDLPPLPYTSEEEYMGGWELTEDVYNKAASHPAAMVLSFQRPRVVHFRSFLSPDEVQHLIDLSKEHLVRSEVLHNSADDSVSDVRTSFGYWPPQTAITRNITNRIHRLVGIPDHFGEDLYVLNYKRGQQYEAHNDQCMSHADGRADPACLQFLKRGRGPKCGPGHGGPSCGDRMATFILSLKAPVKGGKTVFPAAAKTESALKGHRHGVDHKWYCENEGVLGAAPDAGDALLFWDYEPGTGPGTGSYEDGTAQPSANVVYEAMHSGCPVLEGEKWIVTRWIRGAGFDYVPKHGH